MGKTTVEYDPESAWWPFYYPKCDRSGCPLPEGFSHRDFKDAQAEAKRHDKLHADGVIK
ncbi:hypothetical protein [Micromonospora sp. CA-248212]|uniref:hypothetical protein n=1 Tax=Micromonospora sp. CA-248212 TaxID=3239961 RepID=UPI003D8ECB66